MHMQERNTSELTAGALLGGTKAQILVVEDDVRMQKILHRLFSEQGYAVTVCGDGQVGLDCFRAGRPAAVVLDLMLPNIYGRDLCRTIKAERAGVPVVILSAVSEVADKVLLFELGADDYEIDFLRMTAQRSGQPTSLTAHEFKLLRYFVDHPERVLSREELLNEVWGYNSYPTTRTVDNQILKLRQKLERDAADPRYIRTVHGAGYKFVP
jgi:DNA-binding response OmpR family regulator